MDRSLFPARLLGPTFTAIALGMLTNLGTYESMIAEVHTGILFYLSGLLSLVAGLAIEKKLLASDEIRSESS